MGAVRTLDSQANLGQVGVGQDLAGTTSTKIGPGRWPASWVQNPALASTRRPKSSTLPADVRLGRHRA